MTKTKTKQSIINRINILNKRIDLKIINGESYKEESIEHRNLVMYLKDNFQ